MRVCQAEGRRSGPAFAYPSGQLASSAEYNAMFLKYLVEIQSSTDLIEDKIDVIESFGTSRTLRKTAEARAARAGLPPGIQDKMNRWKTVEAADGRKPRPRFQMRDLCRRRGPGSDANYVALFLCSVEAV